LAIETIAFQASHAINSLRHIHVLKEKENNLIITQSRFNQLVNLMNDIVWKANGDGTEIIDLNNSFKNTMVSTYLILTKTQIFGLK